MEKTSGKDFKNGDGSGCSTEMSTYDRIKQHNGSLFPLADHFKNELFSEQAKELINTLLDPQPAHRMTAEQLLTSTWLADEKEESHVIN